MRCDKLNILTDFTAVAPCSHALFASWPCLLLQVKVQSHVTFLGSMLFLLFHYFSLPGSNINCRYKEKQARLAGLEPGVIPKIPIIYQGNGFFLPFNSIL